MTKVAISGLYGSESADLRLEAIPAPKADFPAGPDARKPAARSPAPDPLVPAQVPKHPRSRLAGHAVARAAIRAAWGLPFPSAIFALWWLASAQGWVPEQILPPPPLVYRNLADLVVSGDLSMHIGISATRLFWGFAAGAGLGLPLGLLLGLWSPARDYILPAFKVIAQVPILGWIPMLMMLVGIDEALKIIIIAKAVCIPITLNTCKGLQGIPSLWIEVAKVYRFTRWQLLVKVVAPAAFPQIWAGIRYGLTHGWLALVVVELLASSEGLGFLIVYGRQLFQLDTVLAAVVVVGSVGWGLDKILSVTESRLLRWRREAF